MKFIGTVQDVIDLFKADDFEISIRVECGMSCNAFPLDDDIQRLMPCSSTCINKSYRGLIKDVPEDMRQLKVSSSRFEFGRRVKSRNKGHIQCMCYECDT